MCQDTASRRAPFRVPPDPASAVTVARVDRETAAVDQPMTLTAPATWKNNCAGSARRSEAARGGRDTFGVEQRAGRHRSARSDPFPEPPSVLPRR